MRALPKLKVAPNLILQKNTKIFYSSVQSFNLLQILIRKYAKQNVDYNRTISCVFAFSDKSKRNVFRIQNTIVLRCERSPWTSKKWSEALSEVTNNSFENSDGSEILSDFFKKLWPVKLDEILSEVVALAKAFCYQISWRIPIRETRWLRKYFLNY